MRVFQRDPEPAKQSPKCVVDGQFSMAFVASIALRTGGFLWDDDHHVTPAALRSLGGLARIWFDVGATLAVERVRRQLDRLVDRGSPAPRSGAALDQSDW